MQLAADSGARAASGSRGQHDYDSQCKYTCTDAPFTRQSIYALNNYAVLVVNGLPILHLW